MILGGLTWLVSVTAAFAQNIPPTTTGITVVAPSLNGTYMGVLNVDVVIVAPATPPLTATLRQEGVFAPLATSALTLSGNDHYIAVFALPAVASPTGMVLTVTDGTRAAQRPFMVGVGTVDPLPPQPPSATFTQIMALLAAMASQADTNQKVTLESLQKGFAQLAPLPTPTGIPCRVASATTVYANGHWKVTLDCPSSIAPAPPAKESTIAVFGATSAAIVRK